MTDGVRVREARLAEFIAAAFVKVGMPEGDAATVAALMAEARGCRRP